MTVSGLLYHFAAESCPSLPAGSSGQDIHALAGELPSAIGLCAGAGTDERSQARFGEGQAVSDASPPYILVAMTTIR